MSQRMKNMERPKVKRFFVPDFFHLGSVKNQNGRKNGRKGIRKKSSATWDRKIRIGFIGFIRKNSNDV